jgi:hypothetical protein
VNWSQYRFYKSDLMNWSQYVCELESVCLNWSQLRELESFFVNWSQCTSTGVSRRELELVDVK